MRIYFGHPSAVPSWGAVALLAVYFLSGDHLELQFLLSLVCVAISLGVFYWRFGSEFKAFFRAGKSAKS